MQGEPSRTVGEAIDGPRREDWRLTGLRERTTDQSNSRREGEDTRSEAGHK